MRVLESECARSTAFDNLSVIRFGHWPILAMAWDKLDYRCLRICGLTCFVRRVLKEIHPPLNQRPVPTLLSGSLNDRNGGVWGIGEFQPLYTPKKDHHRRKMIALWKVCRMNTVDDPPYKPHQRIGVISNAHAGRDFECSVQAFLSGQGCIWNTTFPSQLVTCTRRGIGLIWGEPPHRSWSNANPTTGRRPGTHPVLSSGP
jgi:hypothetical protein